MGELSQIEGVAMPDLCLQRRNTGVRLNRKERAGLGDDWTDQARMRQIWGRKDPQLAADLWEGCWSGQRIDVVASVSEQDGRWKGPGSKLVNHGWFHQGYEPTARRVRAHDTHAPTRAHNAHTQIAVPESKQASNQTSKLLCTHTLSLSLLRQTDCEEKLWWRRST